ncbi:hypothetical protein O181_028749 [Austropuccinia psidii MF-1]|uniref:Uncharacterized protein n=1 Tax=Austropuccinia psidii MF-1 TaxID=1389203 RepID=A0A9Q3CR83_9BASI|nr:hypothetical protein [Austropuccinia psidii MF-1]
MSSLCFASQLAGVYSCFHFVDGYREEASHPFLPKNSVLKDPALCLKFFSPSRQAIVIRTCAAGLTPTNVNTTICKVQPNIQYTCRTQGCTKPHFTICYTYPNEIEPPKWPPSGGVLTTTAPLQSFMPTSNGDLVVAYNGIFPSPKTPKNQQPPRYLCQKQSAALPYCQSC